LTAGSRLMGYNSLLFICLVSIEQLQANHEQS